MSLIHYSAASIHIDVTLIRNWFDKHMLAANAPNHVFNSGNPIFMFRTDFSIPTMKGYNAPCFVAIIYTLLPMVLLGFA